MGCASDNVSLDERHLRPEARGISGSLMAGGTASDYHETNGHVRRLCVQLVKGRDYK